MQFTAKAQGREGFVSVFFIAKGLPLSGNKSIRQKVIDNLSFAVSSRLCGNLSFYFPVNFFINATSDSL
jgi:hypothetical protein